MRVRNIRLYLRQFIMAGCLCYMLTYLLGGAREGQSALENFNKRQEMNNPIEIPNSPYLKPEQGQQDEVKDGVHSALVPQADIRANQRNGGLEQPLKDMDDSQGNPDDHKLKILNDTKILKAQEYIRKHANPVKKSAIPPTLESYEKRRKRRDPRVVIKDLTMNVDSEKLEAYLLAEKKRRIALGDDDITEIPEVKAEIAKNPTTVPNIIHYTWFSCHKYRVHAFISMKSALEIQRPSIILLHTNCTPSGPYWDEFVKEAGSRLKVVQRTPANTVWGRKVEKVEHQSDVARFEILQEVGGIYMDDDIVILKSLDTLRNNTIVLGESNHDSLASCLVVTNRNAWFLKRWYQEYRNFNGSRWAESSCFVPWALWNLFPTTVKVVKEKMIRPNWLETKYLFHELWDWSNNYAVHLYSRYMLPVDGTVERSLKELAILNTTYGEISRFILWGDKKPRDIADWPEEWLND